MADNSIIPPGFELVDAQTPPTARTPELPPGFELVERPPEPPGVGRRMVQRFLGTDVDDPLELTRMGTSIIGMVGGGIAGSHVPPLPGPAGLVVNPVTGTIVGSMIGAFAGRIAPEATMEAGESLGVLPPGTRMRVGLGPEGMRTVVEGEALLDLATGGGISALRLAGRGAGRLITRSGREGAEAAEAAYRQGIELMPVQVGNSTIARGYVAVMGRFPLLGTSLRKRGQAAENTLQSAIEGIPDRIGPISSWADISEVIYKDGRTLVKDTNARFNRLYEDMFARAEANGVYAIPRETLTKADEILAKIGQQTPATMTGPATPGVTLDKVRAFIEAEILPMRAATAGGTAYSKQSLRQMDGIVSKIDQEIASLEPGQARFALSLLGQLRQSAQKDAVLNLRGADADIIAREMREIDTEFSQTMSQVFETATAKRFGSVRRQGLRGVAADEATRTPVDQIARLVVKMDSPQSIDELAKLVTPETFQRIAAKVFDDAVFTAMKSEGGGAARFDVDTFARQLGLSGTKNQRQSVEAMLARSGGITIKELDDLVAAGRAIASVEIPNVSTFIARRATIGGLSSILSSVVPGLAVAGGATYAGGSVLGMLTLVGGSRLVSSVISNPLNARFLRNVLDKEATTVVRREATVQLLRSGILAMGQAGEITLDEASKMQDVANQTIEAFDRQLRDMGVTEK